MFTVADPREIPSAPVDLPHIKASSQRSSNPSRLSRTAPEARHHSSLLAALREEDTDDDDESSDSDNAFAGFRSTVDGEYSSPNPRTPRGSHRAIIQKDSTDSPTSPLVTHQAHSKTYGFTPPKASAAPTPRQLRVDSGSPPPSDIRVFLSSGASAPIEVLRNQVVTSLTLRMDVDKSDSFLASPVPTFGFDTSNISFVSSQPTTKTLLLPDCVSGDLPSIDEIESDKVADNSSNLPDPDSYRELMMKLGDLKYICIRAATEVSDDGDVTEREYWLPLDETHTVGDIKTLAAGADLLEHDGPKLLNLEAGESTLDIAATTQSGRLLDDHSTVFEEGLTHNTVVRLCVRKDANVTVKMRGTKDLEVTLTQNETAASLRAKLEQLRPGYSRDLGGLGLRDQKSQLFFGGQELRDGPLNAYGVADGATLELRPHGNGLGVHGGIGIPTKLRERHSWNAHGAHWKPAAVASNGSWVSHSSHLSGGIDDSGSAWSGFGGSASSSSSERYGSPEVARSFDLARRGLAMGNRPTLASGGTGGAYFLRGSDGETCAVFKPADEEPNARNNPRGRNVSNASGEGLRKGTRVGEGASREVAAYLLDHDGFASVPATSLANLCDQKEESGKLGSLQAFVRADAEAEELGPGLFPIREVHKITQLDIRLANTDRNAGNILVQKCGGGSDKNEMFLVPIDHGYALPHTLEDVCFEWEFWPQAKIPYDDETKAYIASLDVEQDVEHLRSEAIDLAPASERVLRVCTVLLQKAASRGCCPADIAGMMSRPMPNRLSDLEKLASRAAGIALGGSGGVTPTPLVDSWSALDGNQDAESKFLLEYANLLDSYLEGFEPELTL